MIKFYNKVFKLYYELQGVGHRQLKLDKFTFDLSLFFLLYTHFLQVTLRSKVGSSNWHGNRLQGHIS